MRSEIKILFFLLRNRGRGLTIKKVAERLHINYRIAHEEMHSLEKENAVLLKKAGNANLCEATYRFTAAMLESEYERRGELLKNKNFLILYSRLAEMKFPFIALLFGSQAKGTAQKYSDIDILTIGGNQKEIGMAISILPGNIHLTSVTYGQFIQMAKNKEFTVVSEAIKNNIIILGIEEYYRLLNNAGYE